MFATTTPPPPRKHVAILTSCDIQSYNIVTRAFRRIRTHVLSSGNHQLSPTEANRARLSQNESQPTTEGSNRAFTRPFWFKTELTGPKSRSVVACDARKAGVNSPYG